MKRILVATLVCIAVLSSCDLSSVFGKKTSDSSSSVVPLQSFSVTAAANSGVVTTDYVAVISAPNIYLELPENVITDNLLVTPTSVLGDGYSISPTGSCHLTDSEIIVLTNSSGVVTNYTLHLSIDPNTVSGGSSSSILLGLSVTKALNSTYCTQDYTATISGKNVYISLPYTIVANSLTVTPTITVASGYTCAQTGTFVLADGTVLVVSNSSTGAVSNFTVHVSVDANTIAFIKLSKPFYWDTSGVMHSMSDSNTVLTLDVPTNTYTLTLQTDTFGLYGPTVCSAPTTGILHRPIGFNTITSSSGATLSTASAQSGAVMPYTFSLTPKGSNTVTTYTICSARTNSSSTAVTNVSYTMVPVYSMNNTYTDNGGTQTAITNLGDYLTSINCNTSGKSFSTGQSYRNIYFSTSGAGYNSPSTVTYIYGQHNYTGTTTFTSSITTSAAQYNSNTSLLSWLPSASVTYSYGSSIAGDNGTSLAISATGSYSSPSSTSVSQGSHSILFGGSFYVHYDDDETNGGSDSVTSSVTSTISVPYWYNTSYTSQSFYEITSITVKISLAQTISAIVPTSIVASNNQTSNDTDHVITFYLNSYTTRYSGNVATILVTAEAGNTASDIISLN
jgi:hypothetical protein